jgi:hypothetical protein
MVGSPLPDAWTFAIHPILHHLLNNNSFIYQFFIVFLDFSSLGTLVANGTSLDAIEYPKLP